MSASSSTAPSPPPDCEENILLDVEKSMDKNLHLGSELSNFPRHGFTSQNFLPGTYAAALADVENLLTDSSTTNNAKPQKQRPLHILPIVTHGSFNPPHADHLRMLKYAVKTLEAHYREKLNTENVIALGFYGITCDSWLESKNLSAEERFSEEQRGEMVRRMAIEGTFDHTNTEFASTNFTQSTYKSSIPLTNSETYSSEKTDFTRLYLADDGTKYQSSRGMKMTIGKKLKQDISESVDYNNNVLAKNDGNIRKIPEPVFLKAINLDGEDVWKKYGTKGDRFDMSKPVKNIVGLCVARADMSKSTSNSTRKSSKNTTSVNNEKSVDLAAMPEPTLIVEDAVLKNATFGLSSTAVRAALKRGNEKDIDFLTNAVPESVLEALFQMDKNSFVRRGADGALQKLKERGVIKNGGISDKEKVIPETSSTAKPINSE